MGELDVVIKSKLFPNLLTMVIQLTSTGVLFLVMRKYLWSSIRSYLEKRSQLVEDRLKEAEVAKIQAQANEKMVNQRLREAGIEANKIIEKATIDAVRIKESIIADGRKEADNRLQAARREIVYEKEQMRSEVKKEIVDVALIAATKLIEQEFSSDLQRKHIEEFVKEVVN